MIQEGRIKHSRIKERYRISGIIPACGDGDGCMVLRGAMPEVVPCWCRRLCRHASRCAGGWGNECTSDVGGCAVAVSEDASEDVSEGVSEVVDCTGGCTGGCLVIMS